MMRLQNLKTVAVLKGSELSVGSKMAPVPREEAALKLKTKQWDSLTALQISAYFPPILLH